MYETLYPKGWETATPRLKRLVEMRDVAKSHMNGTYEKAEEFVKSLRNDSICSRMSAFWSVVDWVSSQPNSELKTPQVLLDYLIGELSFEIRLEAKPVLENYRMSWCKHHALQFKMEDTNLVDEVRKNLEKITEAKYREHFSDIY